LGGDHQFGGCGLGSHGFDTRGCFFDFPGAGLAAAVDFRLGFLGRAVFLVAATLGFLGASVTGVGFRLGGGVVVALTTRPLGRRVSTPLAKVHLLGRGAGPLGFRSGGTVRGGALSGTFGRLLCKGSPRLFPLNTAPVVCRVVSSVAPAQAVRAV
jgi:hypothetical protein